MEIHLTKKDFRIDWYSGSGAGGQHRNKHQNCCRILHIESGLSSKGTGSRSRQYNQREAFTNLAPQIIEWYKTKEEKVIFDDVIRNYNEQRDEVLDKTTGNKFSYNGVVFGNHFSKIVQQHKGD